MTLLEIALDDVAGARIAELAGADRVELCSGLDSGGVTPSIGMALAAASALQRTKLQRTELQHTEPRGTELALLIRPRAGDFVYAPDEVAVMVADVRALRQAAPVASFVVGALTADGHIDVPVIEALLEAAGGADVAFHRAFDSSRDLGASLDRLVQLGLRRVLTSGGRRTAVDGIPTLRALVERAGDDTVIVAGGGVRPGNVRQIVAETGVPEVHLRAARPRVRPVRWSNPEQDYDVEVLETDGELIAQMRAVLS